MIVCRVDDSIELRPWEERHADEFFSVVDRDREHLRRWLPWADTTKSVDDTLQFIRRSLQQFANNNGFHGGVWVDGTIAGGFGLHYINWKSRKTEIGYFLFQEFEGRGIMTRSCAAFIHYLFDELKLNRVAIECAVENERSRAVLRRLGFKEEGILRQVGFLHGQHVDHAVYGLLADEWKRRKSST